MPRNLTPWNDDLPNYDSWKEGKGQKLPGSPWYDSEVKHHHDETVPEEFDTVEDRDDELDLWDVHDWSADDEW